MITQLYKVSGHENPNVFVDSPTDVYKTDTGWEVEDVMTRLVVEFKTQEEAEEYASYLEGWYESGPDYYDRGEY